KSVSQLVALIHGIVKTWNAVWHLVDATFDFRSAAAAVLVPMWVSRVPEQQDAFTRLFSVFLERGFVAALGSKARVAGGVSIQYVSESIDGESANVATTLLTRAGQELPVDYRMVRQGARWKMQDVVVGGGDPLVDY